MKQSKITGIIGTLAVHVLVVVLLFLLKLAVPEKQEEGGVPVMLGNTAQATGSNEQYSLTEVDVMTQPEQLHSEANVADNDVEQPMITQNDEPSIKIKEESNKKKEQQKSENKKNEITKNPDKELIKEKTEAEKRAEAERAAAEAAASKIAGAFGKGQKMESSGTSVKGSGFEGSAEGNSSMGGNDGAGASVAFDLNGRSVGEGGLPRPVYNVQEEGRVVITIVVNPAGQVISTSINKRTNTVNPVLRKAAEDAARKARFNSVDGVNNQSGTITYYFRLK